MRERRGAVIGGVLLGGVLLGGGLVFAAAWLGRPGAVRAAMASAAAPPAIRTVFLRDCATCHGADARGTDLGPDLRGVGAAKIDYYVSSGRMPLSAPDERVERHAPAYSPATVRALVAYTAQLAGGGPAIPSVGVGGDLAVGGSLYQSQCAACHQWSGDGGALLNREAPPLHAATQTQIAEAVRTGPGNMPAFGNAALTDAQLRSVIRYVRYLDHPEDRGGNPLWHLGPMAEGAVAVFLGLGALIVAMRWIGTRT